MNDGKQINILLLNMYKGNTKKENNPYTSISFIFADKECKSNAEKFKGYGVQTLFYNSTTVFEKIPFDLIGQRVVATFVEESRPENPLDTRKLIKSIEYDGKNIDIL